MNTIAAWLEIEEVVVHPEYHFKTPIEIKVSAVFTKRTYLSNKICVNKIIKVTPLSYKVEDCSGGRFWIPKSLIYKDSLNLINLTLNNTKPTYQ